jgi:hypothetical protein
MVKSYDKINQESNPDGEALLLVNVKASNKSGHLVESIESLFPWKNSSRLHQVTAKLHAGTSSQYRLYT